MIQHSTQTGGTFAPPVFHLDVDRVGPDGRRRPRAVAWALRSVPGLARVIPLPAPSSGQSSAARFAGDLCAAVPDLRRIARRFVSQDTLADDLVQLTCLRALERRQQFQMGTNLLGWLSTILRNLHRDELRRRRYQATLEAQLADLERAGTGDDRQMSPIWTNFTVDDVRQAAQTLPEEMRDAYLLYSFDNLTYVAIARRLGVPMATVATRLYRARLKLRELLVARLAPPGSPPAGDVPEASCRC